MQVVSKSTFHANEKRALERLGAAAHCAVFVRNHRKRENGAITGEQCICAARAKVEQLELANVRQDIRYDECQLLVEETTAIVN